MKIRMKTLGRSLITLSLAAALSGCGGGAGGSAMSPADKSGRKARDGSVLSKAAAKKYDQALEAFIAQDKAQNWDAGACKNIAGLFEDAADEQLSDGGKPIAEAHYNAGLAEQRCGNDSAAQKHFEQALEIDGTFHRSKAQLALYTYKRTGDIDGAIRDLDQIIQDAKFQNTEGLVALAALQMQRGGDSSGPGCKDDLSCAKLNLQRALAINDSFMPAFNQLAVYYLEQAKANAGAKRRKGRGRNRGGSMVVSGAKGLDVNAQQLDLAALVASQAQRKNPNYAPIHNTVGLIMVQLKNYNGAVKAFGTASRLDPKFFEAHMNYAAVNLSFRGFKEAEDAFRKALSLNPKEYEAHLGLALALRGQINDSNFEKYVAEAQKHLDEAKKIAPDRAETYYNEAILTQEYRSKRGKAVPMLEKAAKQYDEFIAKAGGDAAFAEAVKRSKDRSQDIRDTVQFIKDGEEAAKNAPPPPPPPADDKAATPDAAAGQKPAPGPKK